MKISVRKAEKIIKEYAVFAVLLILYGVPMFIIPNLSRTQDMLVIGNARLPLSGFAGVVSSLSNICIICLVLFYRKTGFYTAMAVMVIQVPGMFKNIIIDIIRLTPNRKAE